MICHNKVFGSIYRMEYFIFQVNPNEQVNHHFVAFIEKDGKVYELDGRKDYPIEHGDTTPEGFLFVSFFLNWLIFFTSTC